MPSKVWDEITYIGDLGSRRWGGGGGGGGGGGTQLVCFLDVRIQSWIVYSNYWHYFFSSTQSY